MNIVEKVNNREITPRHNNYQEVTIDAAGNGPVINFNGVHARTSGLQGFSPLKQSIEYSNKKANSEKVPEKSWYDKFSSVGHGVLDVAGMVPVFGAAADLINAGWYAGEGYAQDKGYLDETGAGEGAYQNAAISGLAAIPGVGQYATAAKYGKKGFDAIKFTAKNSPKSFAFDAALGTDMAQTSYEDYDKEFGDGSFKKSYSPFFGSENNEGIIPYAAKKYYEYDAKDGEEGNVFSQGFNDLKGGITNLLNKNNNEATDTNNNTSNNASNNTSEQSKPTKSNRPQKFIDYYKNKNKNN